MQQPKPHGPDISHHQDLAGPRDPAWVLGSAKCSEGQQTGDREFLQNWAWLEGIKYRGAYHWLRSDSPIAAQANNVVKRVREANGSRDLQRGDMIQNDWEVTPGIPLVTHAQVQEFNDRVRQAFSEDCVITYSSDWLPDSTLDPDSVAEFLQWRWINPTEPLWYANYNTGAGPTGGWAECLQYRADVWQWTSKYVHPSIVSSSGGFDMNHVFNFATLDRICRRVPITPPPPSIITPGEPMNVLSPAPRIYDTRTLGQPLLGGTVRQVAVGSHSAVMANLTVTGAGEAGYLQAWGAGPRPSSSVLNFSPGDAIANAVLLPVVNGQITVLATTGCHLVVDVQATWP